MTEKTKKQKITSLIPTLNAAGVSDAQWGNLSEGELENELTELVTGVSLSDYFNALFDAPAHAADSTMEKFDFYLDVLSKGVEQEQATSPVDKKDNYTSLNLVVSAEKVKSLEPPQSVADVLSVSDATPKSNLISFTKFFSKKYEETKALFDFFQENLKEDLNEKREKISQNGVDFERDKQLLGRTIETLRAAISKAMPVGISRGLESRLLVQEKYQVTIVEKPKNEFKGLYIFFPGEETESGTLLYGLWIDKKHFNNESPERTNDLTIGTVGNNTLDNPWLNDACRAYIKDIVAIAKLAKSDTKRAKNLMNCGIAPGQYKNSLPELLDYKKFSKKYHGEGAIKSEAMTPAEISKYRKQNGIVDVGTKNKTFKAAYTGIGDAFLSIAVDSYVVQKGDVLNVFEPADDKYPFGKIKQDDGKVKPSKLGERLAKFVPPPGKTVTAVITDINGFSDEKLLVLDEEKIEKWSTKSAETGNALTVGERINLPRIAPTDGMEIFSAETYKNVDFATTGNLSGEQIVKIFKQEIVDKLLLQVCPSSALAKLKECLLPSNCRELIKFVGLWRFRKMVEPFAILDSFDDMNGFIEALNQWDSLVEEKYNFKAVKFVNKAALSSGEFAAQDVINADSFSVGFQIRLDPKISFNFGKTRAVVTLGSALSSGTISDSSFSVTISKNNNLNFHFYSPDGKKMTYSTAGGVDFDIFDNLWHQIGFSYDGTGMNGDVKVYVDGRDVKARKISEFSFTGPVATPESARLVLASENFKKSQKPFSGFIDEVVIFGNTFEETDWKKIARIKSNSNLSTDGFATSAKAWWRMGDSLKDDLSAKPKKGKIVDKIGTGIELSQGGEGSAEVVVARVFEQQDMDRFIDMLSVNTSILSLCDMLLDTLDISFSTGWDFDKVQTSMMDKLAFPSFNKDPHITTKILIQDVLVENLIRMFAQFLWKMLQKIFECSDWKKVLQGITRGGLTGNLDVLGEQVLNGPIGDFSRAIENPEEWERMLKQDFTEVQKSWENMLNKIVKIEQSDSPNNSTTLGLGSVSFVDSLNQQTDPNVQPGPLGSTVSIENVSTTTAQDTVIRIVKKTSETLPADEALELFSSNPSPEALATVTSVLNSASNETGMTLSESDVASILGQVGSLLGLESAIDQLQYASQVLKARASLPADFCESSADTLSRLGMSPTAADAEAAKAAFDELMKSLEDIEEMANDDSQCAIPVPLSDEEKSSLNKTITDVYAPILMAYDNDLTLYKLGMTSIASTPKKIKKVLWKGDAEKFQQAGSDGIPKTEIKIIEKTVINPEFEAMLKNGFVPLKKDGKTVDGTRFGGVVKINLNPLDFPWGSDGGFLTELRPPKSLSPTVDGDKVEDPDVEIRDIGASLGPYTDYTEEYAIMEYPRVKLSGKASSAFSANMKDFVLSDNASGAAYFRDRDNLASGRGVERVDVKSRTSLIESPTPNSNEKSSDTLRSDIEFRTAFGRSLSSSKLFDFNQSIKRMNQDSFTPSFPAENDFKVLVPFSVSPELRRALESFGYRETSEDCDDEGTAAALTGSPNAKVLPENERYTPQEHAFENVVNRNRPTGIPISVLKNDAYNSLYREVLTALIYEASDSPLLKPVPGLKDAQNEEVLAMNFLNLNTSPRLLDIQSFASQVADDYSTLMSCPQDLTEPALYSALKTSLPRMLARMCIVELAVKGIIPFTQLSYGKKDAAVRGFILEKLEKDINLYANQNSKNPTIQERIVGEYNKLAEQGETDTPPIETDNMGYVMSAGWQTAMAFFIEEEFDFVAERLKGLVHGKCIEETPDSAGNLYDAIFDYARLEDKDIKFTTYAVMKPNPSGEIETTTDFSVRTQYEKIDKLGVTLSYFYNEQEIVLSNMEQSMEDFLAEFPIDLTQEELDCDFAAIYPANGTTTEVDSHSHTYSIDENGNGITNEVNGHTHAIHQYAVVPAVDNEGNVTHSHSLIPRTTQASIEENFSETLFEKHMQDKLVETDSFKVMFDFCFNLQDVATVVLAYYLASIEDQIMAKTFTSTKKAILDLFKVLWEDLDAADASAAACSDKQAQAKGLQSGDFFPDISDAFLNPEFLLMMLLAPLNTYKGWSKVADPHVFITTTIMDLLRMPSIPKNVKRNIPDIDNPGEMKCADMPDFRQAISISDALMIGGSNIWTFNGPEDLKPGLGTGAPVPDFVVENLVQTGVTFAPLLVGLPPYPATPFGYIYYFAVSPLIWLLKDLPRLIEALSQNPEANAEFARLVASTGLSLDGTNFSCPDDPSSGETSENDQAPSAEEEEGCPPVRSFNQTAIEPGGSASVDDC